MWKSIGLVLSRPQAPIGIASSILLRPVAMARGQLSCKMRNSTAQHIGGNSKQKATHPGRDTLARGWQVFNPEASRHHAVGGALGRVASIMWASWILCAHASHSLRKPRHSCGGMPPPCCATVRGPAALSGILIWPRELATTKEEYKSDHGTNLPFWTTAQSARSTRSGSFRKSFEHSSKATLERTLPLRHLEVVARTLTSLGLRHCLDSNGAAGSLDATVRILTHSLRRDDQRSCSLATVENQSLKPDEDQFCPVCHWEGCLPLFLVSKTSKKSWSTHVSDTMGRTPRGRWTNIWYVLGWFRRLQA